MDIVPQPQRQSCEGRAVWCWLQLAAKTKESIPKIRLDWESGEGSKPKET